MKVKCPRCLRMVPASTMRQQKRACFPKICKYCHDKQTNYTKRQTPEATRRANLKSKYGITLEDYNAILASQNFRCAICRTDDPKHKGRFVVDHCHKTGKVRGLLCQRCNWFIGQAMDDTAYLLAAVAYLSQK